MLQSTLLATRSTNRGQRSGLKRFSTCQLNSETPGVADEAAEVSKKPFGVSRRMMIFMRIMMMIIIIIIIIIIIT